MAGSSAATNGMHDFDLIIFDQERCGMLAARYDVPIELDRQPAPSQFQALQQIGHRLTVRELVALAVQLNVHSDRHHSQGARILARSTRRTKAPSAAIHLPSQGGFSAAKIPGRKHQTDPSRQKCRPADGRDDAQLAHASQSQQVQTAGEQQDAERE